VPSVSVDKEIDEAAVAGMVEVTVVVREQRFGAHLIHDSGYVMWSIYLGIDMDMKGEQAYHVAVGASLLLIPGTLLNSIS